MKNYYIIYCIIYFEHKNDSPTVRILHTKLDYACHVIFMLKMNYTIAFNGISVKQCMSKHDLNYKTSQEFEDVINHVI